MVFAGSVSLDKDTTVPKQLFARPDSTVRESVGYVTRLNAANNNATAAAVTNAAPRTKRGASK